VTSDYFLDQEMSYEKEALLERSKDLIATYTRSPKVFTELLVRLRFFALIEDEEDRVAHNEAVKYLYDMGIFELDNALSVTKRLLSESKIPSAYIAKDQYGGEDV